MIGNIENLLSFSGEIHQKKELKPLFSEISAIAQYLWERGWAERNAGNFSVNITRLFSDKDLDPFSSFPFFPLGRAYPDLSRTLLVVSGMGTRMRDTAKNPAANVCILYISDSGSAYHIIHPASEELPVRPTSELATHLAIHQQLLQKGSPEKTVLHAHVTELIALTQATSFPSEEPLNALLWGMHPETLLYLPDGVGFIPYLLAGTESIAQATVRGLGNHKAVIWEKHGCLSVGGSLSEAFDVLDIIAKSARIYFLCKSAGMEPAGLTPAQMQQIRAIVH
jgi:rhamnulose-1-phosphate aldolase